MSPLVKDSMKDLRGYPSSTRIKSWYTLLFTLYFIPFYVLVMIGGMGFLELTGEALTSFMFVMSGLLVTILGILFTAAFYPSQLNKKTETNEIIEVTRTLNKDPLQDEKE